MSYSIVTVPLYDTLGPDAVRYISNHAELSAVACSVAVLPMLLQSLQGCPSIFLVVSRSKTSKDVVYWTISGMRAAPMTCRRVKQVFACRLCLA